MNRRSRVAGGVAAGLACALIAVGPPDAPDGPPAPAVRAGTPGPDLGIGADRAAGANVPAGARLGPAGELRVPAQAATWVGAEGGTGPGTPLWAGDQRGGAVTYLKFVLPAYRAERATGPVRLQLTSTGQPLPELVELVSVPDTGWDPERLTWQNAPVLGTVVQSVRPDRRARQVSFELTGPAAGPGVRAFAVTVPPDRGVAAFVGADGSPGEPVLRLPQPATGPSPSPSGPASPAPAPGPSATPVPGPSATPVPGRSAAPEPSAQPAPTRTGPVEASPYQPPGCVLSELLVPTCGVLWGVAPDAHTGSPRVAALTEFEALTGRRQDIYHAYHRGTALFPTAEEVAIAAEGRLLFLNWKPRRWTWAQLARGHPAADAYLDRLAAHIQAKFPQPFFLTIHHEPENDVRPWRGSGWQARDYAAMYRYVVQRLRGNGVDNLVTVMSYMAYVPWNTRPWFPELYPGDDVVDWIAWDTYAYSRPGYGHGDFAEMMNRRSGHYPDWPGFYTWATAQFPDKPFMLGEWGVWHSRQRPGHMAQFYGSVARQTPLFPRMKALVYFDTAGDQRARDSRPSRTGAGLAAYRALGAAPYFQVRLETGAQLAGAAATRPAPGRGAAPLRIPAPVGGRSQWR
jgi:hypothetical protein